MVILVLKVSATYGTDIMFVVSVFADVAGPVVGIVSGGCILATRAEQHDIQQPYMSSVLTETVISAYD